MSRQPPGCASSSKSPAPLELPGPLVMTWLGIWPTTTEPSGSTITTASADGRDQDDAEDQHGRVGQATALPRLGVEGTKDHRGRRTASRAGPRCRLVL